MALKRARMTKPNWKTWRKLKLEVTRRTKGYSCDGGSVNIELERVGTR